MYLYNNIGGIIMFKLEYYFTNYSTNSTINGELVFGGDRNEYKTRDILNHIAWELEDFHIPVGTGLIGFENVVAPY
jgi:hypothetical protein